MDNNKKPENDKNKLIEPIKQKEIGGYEGQDPTEFDDWQHKGRVSDF